MFFSLCWTKRKQKYIKRNCPHTCRAPDFTYKDKKVTTLKQRRQKSILKKKHGLAQLVMNLPAMQETPVRFLCREAPLEKGKATHSSILAWRILWMRNLAKKKKKKNCFSGGSDTKESACHVGDLG